MSKTACALKMTAAVFAAALILAALYIMPVRLAFEGGQSYAFYVGNTSKNCRVVTARGNNAYLKRLTLSGVCGESATYPPDYDWRGFLGSAGANILFCEELSDSVNYYCEGGAPYSVELYGKTVNIHVCVKDDAIIIASPIIFGGY